MQDDGDLIKKFVPSNLHSGMVGLVVLDACSSFEICATYLRMVLLKNVNLFVKYMIKKWWSLLWVTWVHSLRILEQGMEGRLRLVASQISNCGLLSFLLGGSCCHSKEYYGFHSYVYYFGHRKNKLWIFKVLKSGACIQKQWTVDFHD